jgi:hypothetical protein
MKVVMTRGGMLETTTMQRLREVLKLREQGMTLQEIGDRWGVSKERVRQIAGRAARLMSRVGAARSIDEAMESVYGRGIKLKEMLSPIGPLPSSALATHCAERGASSKEDVVSIISGLRYYSGATVEADGTVVPGLGRKGLSAARAWAGIPDVQVPIDTIEGSVSIKDRRWSSR